MQVRVSEFTSLEELSLAWLMRLTAPVSSCTPQGPAEILCLAATEPLHSGGGGWVSRHSPLVQQGSRASHASSQHHTCPEQVVSRMFWVGTAVATLRR